MLAPAPPLGGDHRIEAHQQALAGEIVARDAGQAPGVEQPGLDDLLAGELVDGVVAQGGDPVEAGRLEILVDAGLGDHAPVADQGDAGGAAVGGLVEEQAVELGALGGAEDGAGGAEDGAGGAVEAAGAEGECGAVGTDGEAVGESEAEDEKGAVLDLAVLPVGFGEEVAGGLAGEGGGDVNV